MSDELVPVFPPAAVDESRGGRGRLGAKALLEASSRVLLVRERHADGTPFWTLPGGGLRGAESPATAVRRELREELDCAVVVGDPLSSFWYVHRGDGAATTRYTVLDCTLASGGRPVRAEGVFESQWVDPERPPQGTIPQVRHVLDEVRSDGSDAV